MSYNPDAYKTVSVTKLGDDVLKFYLPNTATVGDFVERSGFSARGMTLLVGTTVVDMSYVPADGDTIVLTPQMKGGQRKCEVTRVGGEVKPFYLEDGKTFNDLLALAEVTLSANETAFVDGEEVDLNDEVWDGAMLVIVPKMKGGAEGYRVEVTRLGERIETKFVAVGSTFRQAVDLTSFALGRTDMLSVNGLTVDPDDTIFGDCTVVIVPQMKGGR